MLSRFLGWFQSFKLNTRSRLGQGFVLLAILLAAITVGTAVLVVQQLNERDLRRIEQVEQLQVSTSVSQLELLSQRYNALLGALAQDDGFAVHTQTPATLRTALARMVKNNPIVHEVLWLNPLGQVVHGEQRMQGQGLAQTMNNTDLVLPDQLLDIRSIKPKELWFLTLLLSKAKQVHVIRSFMVPWLWPMNVVPPAAFWCLGWMCFVLCAALTTANATLSCLG